MLPSITISPGLATSVHIRPHRSTRSDLRLDTMPLSSYWKRLSGSWPWSFAVQQKRNRDKVVSSQDDGHAPESNDYPIFPPPSPHSILSDREEYWTRLASRRWGAPRGVTEDTSLYALYRFYELVVLDEVRPYRNALEAFWRQKDWAVQDIPDPHDEDPERYAFLAGCTYLIARSFNERVKLGLRRDMPALLTPDEAEMLKNVPDHLRDYEKVPSWAEKAAPLAETLSVPTHDGVVLTGKSDERADPDFLSKNILLWTPHISFT